MSVSRVSRILVIVAAASLLLVATPAVAYEDDVNSDWEGLIPENDGAREIGFAETVYPMIFPHLAGETTGYSDTFGACRGTGCSRSHAGIDIMAPKMVPIVAVAAGTVGWMHNEQGGNCCAMALRHDDGWESWYIHMNNDTPGTDDGQGWGFADGIEPGVHVEAGELIGWVGDSGNAESTGSHTHFELHTPDDVVVNPYPSLQAATIIYEPYSPSNPLGCDFDNDGFDDLVIGIPYEDRGLRFNDGAVTVVSGSGEGPDSSTAVLWSQKSAGVDNAPESDDRFGTATACGDVDGDDFDDLIVGIPGEDQGKRDAGALNVIYGSASGLDATGDNFWHQNRPGVPDTNNKWDAFGSTLAVADFNNDSYDDVAVAAPGEAIAGMREAGMVLVFYGHPSGFGAGEVNKWSQDTAGTVGAAHEGDRFGAAMAAGDFNGDGFADLAIGAPDEDFTSEDAGTVTVLFGSSSGLVAESSVRLAQGAGGLEGSEGAGEHFGAALAAGDFDGNGYADLAVGVPGQQVSGSVDAGAVHIVPGSATGLDSSNDWIINAGGGDVPLETGARLGASLAAAGFSPDGFMDLAAGLPGHSSAAGAVVVMHGSDQGPRAAGAQLFTQDTQGVGNAVAAGDGFGTWLSSGDFNGGGGSAWLVVGVPFEDFPGKPNAGALHVMSGGLGGVSGKGSLFLKQNSPGIPGANNAGDGFGHLSVIGR